MIYGAGNPFRATHDPCGASLRARRFLEPNQASWLLAVAANELRGNAENAAPSGFFQRRSRTAARLVQEHVDCVQTPIREPAFLDNSEEESPPNAPPFMQGLNMPYVYATPLQQQPF